MKKIKCIGIGSPQPFDNIGWLIIEHIKVIPLLAQVTESIQLDRPGLRLIEEFNGWDVVFLFDAVKGITPGKIIEYNDISDFANSNQLSSHGFGLCDAVKMASILKLCPQKLMFFGIGIGEYKIVEPAIERLANRIEYLIAPLLA
jgi:hydrogenase maturation protease